MRYTISRSEANAIAAALDRHYEAVVKYADKSRMRASERAMTKANAEPLRVFASILRDALLIEVKGE